MVCGDIDKLVLLFVWLSVVGALDLPALVLKFLDGRQPLLFNVSGSARRRQFFLLLEVLVQHLRMLEIQIEELRGLGQLP